MAAIVNLHGSLLHDDVFTLLQNQSPFALTQWLANTLVDFLRLTDDETQLRLLSFAWATSVLRDSVQLRYFGDALSSVSSTSDVGLDIALVNLLRARLAIAELKQGTHNTHWLRAAQILESLPHFTPHGFQLAQARLAEIL